MSNASACPCATFAHPGLIFNRPGLDVVRYRVGDFTSFRHALLRSLPNEIELINWRPGAQGDLAVQMMEWWAYLADILTFYNERIANQDYLRTADLPESVTRLIQVLGYRSRPGIGAQGVLGVLLTGTKPVHLAPIFAVQDKPGPGKQPQIFELDAPIDLRQPDAIPAEPAPNPSLFSADHSILLKGVISSLKPGTRLLLANKGWDGNDSDYAVVTVNGTSEEKDPRGRINTRVQISLDYSHIPGTAKASDYRLLGNAQNTHAWQYPANSVIGSTHIELESLVRDVCAGQMLLLDAAQITASAPTPQLVRVTNCAEKLWFANPKSSANPSVQPDPPTIGIPVLHSSIDFKPAIPGNWNAYRSSVAIGHNWQSVGELIASPLTIFDASSRELLAVAPAVFPQRNGQAVFIEDADGYGISAIASVGTDGTTMQLSGLPETQFTLKAPLRVLFNLVSVSRGKTVLNEVLGSGDAAQANQEFVLTKSPLTYLRSGDSSLGANYKSTLKVWVDGLQWQEAPNFYEQPSNARIFVTREDESHKTHVKFGDGVNGARLSSGLNNVVASYRYGSGKYSPDAGSLTVILNSQSGLGALRNPIAVSGGDDPDPPARICQYAPKSVLTFGRAVSGDDYETIAAQTPGVARAKCYWGWDDARQRSLVRIYVGNDEGAKSAAQIALAAAVDPNRAFSINLATPIPIAITLTVSVTSDRVLQDVKDEAATALIDADHGLLGANVVGIGQRFYKSQVFETCLSVKGTVAVQELQIQVDRGSGFQMESAFRYDPGEGGFFQLLARNLHITAQAGNHGN